MLFNIMLINFSISIKILLLLQEAAIFEQICAQKYNLDNWLTRFWNTRSMTRFHYSMRTIMVIVAENVMIHS
jgi:hypothetical protein